MTGLSNPVARIGDLIDLGGPVVALLLGLSVLALATIVYKAWQFRAIKPLSRVGEPSSRLLGDIAREARRLAPKIDAGAITRQDAEDAIATRAASQLRGLQSGFRLLDSIAQISPLIGLFGTVLGMISAFQALQGAGNAVDPSVLAGGIWVALLTTAVGLAVAMPTSLALTYFESRAERYRLAIEQCVTGALNPAAGNGFASSVKGNRAHAG